MFRKFLQRLGIVRTPDYVFTKYNVRVFIMSEGTAQGTPRPLAVISTSYAWELDCAGPFYIPAEHLMETRVANIIRHGFTHELINGSHVKYGPRAIYKVMYEVAVD